MEKGPREANSHSASQEIPRVFWKKMFTATFTTASQTPTLGNTS